MMKINGLTQPTRLIDKTQVNNIGVKKANFGELLSNAIGQVDSAEKVSQEYDMMVATGEVDNLHDAMIAAQKAEITLNFALEIRSQVLDAYKELMRIQV
ncbi:MULTISPECIES: flagellar hook-basal body complex protein FliE [unclassified Fusibacter]|uniref:flagellar hook-basal body complex protein FliE n=1 Tax=unclassified Fusibacter TaxID=2624464 RepID=UPI0010119692|nr:MULTISPECIES: flagellar hook-basal body complex protein FliE [unclassified Fusibacter]MCK8058753.1 flagellar hook-basal body complex protein FliE [Fusibacter sp. A2]NPE21827.1 flagellar hook-basal body complex protein FliE [Fusibacter sp. A1]RXV61399.1 flagellar hook-basal body complex protein FliE [Fusibacter sp. A1]